MRVFRTLSNLPRDARGASVAIGNFDGVHRGHRAVIDLAMDWGRKNNTPSGVLTFEPHPRSFFAPDAPPFRLMSPQARAHRMDMIGLDLLFEQPFDMAFAALSAEDFVTGVLGDQLGLRHAVVGADFCFGQGRRGNVEMLRALGARQGLSVSVAPLLSDDGAEISSTAIRRALSDGAPQDAARVLGHWHRIEGPVLHGEKRGRDLGFPTANMSVDGLHLPRFGVYAVLVDVLTGPHVGRYQGAASMGVRPMFGTNTPNLETYLFDFSGDLYGATVSVALVAFLRPESRFDSLEALIAQMTRDCDTARARLAEIDDPKEKLQAFR